MTDRDDDLIKKRAYALWESEGRPDGRHDAHWDQAYKELSDGDDTAVLGEPESHAAPVDEPAKAARPKAEKAPTKPAPPVSAGDQGTAGSPGGKRKRKTV